MGAQKKILIVDDYEESCTLLKDILNDSYDCLTTQDSTQTFDLLSSYKPNLVILIIRCQDDLVLIYVHKFEKQKI